jgi:hypothetical protein
MSRFRQDCDWLPPLVERGMDLVLSQKQTFVLFLANAGLAFRNSSLQLPGF